MIDDPGPGFDDQADEQGGSRSRRRGSGTDVALSSTPTHRLVTPPPVIDSDHPAGGALDRVAVITAEEARHHREARSELLRTRLWGVIAVPIGLVGAGAGLLSVASNNVKAGVPVVAALVGVLATAAVAYSANGMLRRWGASGARNGEARVPGGLGLITDALAEQRTDARRSAASTVLPDG
ncbi:MAG: hypothetical protein ABSG64_04825 [Solirubrobacteraceae bacterium]|jgi:hypothetical protein